MLDIKNLTFSYKNSNKIIDHMNLHIEKGSFVSIVGHSGCGKSTLLRLIAGLEKPNEGMITGSNEIQGMSMAVVFQNYTLFPWMTAEKNISFFIKKIEGLSKSESLKKARLFLSKVGMAHEGKKYPCQLSGGMKQRVAIARAFATNSEVLLMDEPFGALDVNTRNQMQNLLVDVWRENQENKTVLFVTHDINEAVRLSDRIIFIKGGNVYKDYDIKKIKDKHSNDSSFQYQNIIRKIENAF